MAINVKPLSDRVLVKPLEEKETKKGGIIIPDSAKEKPQEGEIVALGTGKVDEQGKKIEFTVSSSPSTAAQRSSSRARTISSCAKTISWASWAKSKTHQSKRTH
jgi:co-chaperonin GroES (HSP10)